MVDVIHECFFEVSVTGDVGADFGEFHFLSPQVTVEVFLGDDL